jgi:Zn-dependent protease with chaperone function
MARVQGQHWSDRARSWISWRVVISSWQLAMVAAICLVNAGLSADLAIGAKLRLLLIVSLVAAALLAPRTATWTARLTGIPRPRSALRGTIAFQTIFLSSLWITLAFGSFVPARYDAGGIAWALLLLLALLLNGLGASGWLLTVTRILRPAGPHVVEAVQSARRSHPHAGPDVQVFEVELNQANALAYPGTRIVAFTTVAVEALTPEQLTAIAAHELEHLQESRSARAVRAAWSMAFALPVLFFPVLPHAPAHAFLLGFVLFFLAAFAYRYVSRRLEQRADHAATHHGQDGTHYALALERLYELNLMPAVTRTRQAHPHLYDRLIAAGVTPGFPRPRPPAFWPQLFSPLFVFVCGVALLAAQIFITSRLSPGLNLRSDAQINWAVALEGKEADWLSIAAHWLEQRRPDSASLALDLTDRRDKFPTQILRAGLAARDGDCERATALLTGAGLTGPMRVADADPSCSELPCTDQLFNLCTRRCNIALREYSHLLKTCPP